VLVLPLIEQEPHADLLARQSIAQDEIAVAGKLLGVGERDLGTPLAVGAGAEVMRRRSKLLNRHSGRERAPQAKPAPWSLAFVCVAGFDEFVSRRGRGLPSGGVARSDNSRVDELVESVGRYEQLGVL